MPHSWAERARCATSDPTPGEINLQAEQTLPSTGEEAFARHEEAFYIAGHFAQRGQEIAQDRAGDLAGRLVRRIAIKVIRIDQIRPKMPAR